MKRKSLLNSNWIFMEVIESQFPVHSQYIPSFPCFLREVKIPTSTSRLAHCSSAVKLPPGPDRHSSVSESLVRPTLLAQNLAQAQSDGVRVGPNLYVRRDPFFCRVSGSMFSSDTR
jgi:hypothetical protein